MKLRSMATPFLLLASLHATSVIAADEPKGDPKNGKAIFLADGCYQCHGRVGQGGPGGALAQTALPYEAYRSQVRKPMSVMPPYTEAVLSEQDLADTYAYVKSLPGPRTGKDLPALLQP